MKILKTALVLTLIGIACGFLIGISHQITDPIIQENLRKQELKAYSALYPSLDEAKKVEGVSKDSVKEVFEIYQGGNIVGYVYKGFHNNNYSSSVEALVGINIDGTFAGVEILKIVQTTADHVNVVVANAKVFKGKNVADIDLVKLMQLSNNNHEYDTATGASYGSTSMRTIVRDAILLFNQNTPPVVTTPYTRIFGLNVTNTEDTTFTTTDKVFKKETIKNASDTVVGYAYTLTSTKNTGLAVEGHDDEDWTLSLLVGVDLEGKIVGIETLLSDHTNYYYNQHSTYFNALKGVAVANYGSVDTVTGASFSRSHILELLTALQGVLV